MNNSIGFWSYVHDDDKADSGRISLLAKDISNQYKMITGDSIGIFLDVDGIKWGEDWRESVDSNLSLIAFFIPVITPRYFMKPECRRELAYFVRKATSLGIKELIMPLIYVDFTALHEQESEDELITLIKTFQWEDWTDIRFSDLTSEIYRKSVFRLATRLVDANKIIEEKNLAIEKSAENSSNALESDESPGYLDQLAEFEESLPITTSILDSIKKSIEIIGEIMSDAADDLNQSNSQPKTFNRRVNITRGVSIKLNKPAEQIYKDSIEFSSKLHKVDEGIRIMLRFAPDEIKKNPEVKNAFCDFLAAIRKMSAESHMAFEKVQEMINSLDPLDKLSRDLRPVLRRLRQGLNIFYESRLISDEWNNLVDANEINCEEET